MQPSKYNFLLLFIFISFSLFSQTKSQLYINYIQNFSEFAVIQQKEFGIPASITLAQGLLESGAGKSEFALRSNNHFGIKCHSDWTGDKVYHDDDDKGECFRKYNDVLDSYRDHSLFLKNKTRYSFLFDYSQTDYESWAHGLKKAGYATDPSYAYKLISLIENYELHQYDLLKSHKRTFDSSSNEHSTISENLRGRHAKISAISIHTIYKSNRVKFVVTNVGDSFESLSDELNISVKKLLEYNELEPNYMLKPGMQIYIKRKKSKASYGIESHVIKSGETMYSISQTYAIRLVKLYELNNMLYTETARIGRVLKLR
ncbi:MAG: glucosaminidase domain-containing protein [Paludibacter sp.]|nr:glucosaminidase domain-containing protein [Paludibacter sp.]